MVGTIISAENKLIEVVINRKEKSDVKILKSNEKEPKKCLITSLILLKYLYINKIIYRN